MKKLGVLTLFISMKIGENKQKFDLLFLPEGLLEFFYPKIDDKTAKYVTNSNM